MKKPVVAALAVLQMAVAEAAPDAAGEKKENEDKDRVTQVEDVVITAVRQKRKQLEVPQTINVVNRKQIDDHIITNMQDLVRHMPGVDVSRQTSGTDPFGNLGGFTIRGASANRVKMQVDGSRAIERITDGNRNFVDLSNMKAVEVVRDPVSVLWGADALGGVVAFQTLDPDDLLKGQAFGAQANTRLSISSSVRRVCWPFR